MLTCVVFCWMGDRPIYTPWHVENMRRMLAKHLTVPHNFVCVTDNVQAMRAADIPAYPLWKVPPMPLMHRGGLGCSARLGLFSPEHGGKLGETLFMIDLDAVIRANIDDMVTTDAPLKVLSWSSRAQIQGGMLLVKPGAVQPDPWALLKSDPALTTRAYRFVGSDQAVMSELFYADVVAGRIPHWDESDGVIVNSQIRGGHENWRVFFRTGHRKCWDAGMDEYAEYMGNSGREIPVILGPVKVRHDDWRNRVSPYRVVKVSR